MSIKDADTEKVILRKRVDYLFQRSTQATWALFITGTIYAAVLTNRFDWQSLLVWYAIFITIIAARLTLTQLYKRADKETISLTHWLNLFRLGLLMLALSLGSLGVFFFAKDYLQYMLLAIIVPYGISAAAVTILVDLVSATLYLTALMLPVVYQTADSEFWGASVLTIVLLIYYLRFNREHIKTFILNTRLLHENKGLVDDLKQEKNRLGNRLGRILTHSSNEIFVVNAHNLKCIQINKGASENLGYSDYELDDLNILEIFTGLNRESFGKLLQPLMSGSQEIAIYRGTNQRRDGSTYPVEARIQLQIKDDPPAIIIIAEDTTERDKREEKLIYQANFDQLTGLPNRHYMQQHMGAACVRAKRQKRKIALLFIDLDNFKDINDTLGHKIGDDLLRQTAKRIKNLLRASDMPARTGGDEFMVMLEGLKQQADAEEVANKLSDSFRQPFLIEQHEIFSTISIGISIYPDDGDTMEDLMQHADIAMYNVKQSGRNDFRFFSGEMRSTSDEQAKIASHLRHALERDELSVHFQPKVNIITGRIEGAEALLRWTDSELGAISPVQFIPMAENMGIIKEIGAWVLLTACQETANWQHIYEHPFHVSVNISPRQFISGDLLDDVDKALVQSGLRCDQLELEITESLLMHSSAKTIKILGALRERGISLAMDDFGTGYSSLSYLKHFPLQILKIDRSFISDLEKSEDSRILVKAIISMAESLKMKIVAEGIETRGQLDFCRQHNVQTAQGYLFSKPLSAQEHTSLLKYAPDAYKTIVTCHDTSDVYWRPISDMAD